MIVIKQMMEDIVKNRLNAIYGVMATDKELQKLISFIGYENFIYCDTDSIYFQDSETVRKKINEYNNIYSHGNRKIVVLSGTNSKEVI